MLRLSFGLLALAMVAGAACSSSEESAPTVLSTPSPASGETTGTVTPTPEGNLDREAESDLARSMLLTVQDFPTGWTEDPATTDDDPTPFDRCDSGPAPGRTGAAQSGDFTRGGIAEVTHYTGVFVSTEAMPSQRDRVMMLGGCFVDVLNSGDLDDDGVRYTDARLGEVSFPNLGDETIAYRLSFKASDGSQSFDFYIDIVVTRQGRYVSQLVALDGLSPFPSFQLEELARKAVTKLPRN